MTKEERGALVDQYWSEAKTGQEKSRTQRTTTINFYKGNQWEAADLAKLKEQGRPAMTFNLVKSPIRNTVGYFIQNRQDMKYISRRNGNDKLADIYTEVAKYIFDNCDADWEQRFAFFYGMIGNKGWLSIEIDYDRDIVNGDIVIRSVDPDCVYEDPSNKDYDVNKGLYIFKGIWKTEAEIIGEYPKIDEDDIKSALTMAGDDDKTPIVSTDNDYGDNDNKYPVPENSKFKYLVRECYWKSTEVRKYLVNVKTGEIIEVLDNKIWARVKEGIKKIGSMIGITPAHKTVTRSVTIQNLTTRVGELTLEEKEDVHNGVSSFTLVRFSPDWILGVAKSEIDDLLDAQREVNKRDSQAIHHLNQSVNSGIICDPDSFGEVGCSTWAEVKLFGTKPGVIIRAKKGSRCEFAKPAQLSEGHLTLAALGQEKIKRISGINPDMMGEASEKGTDLSGKAMQQRTQAGMLTTAVIHDNWAYTLKILGRTLLEFFLKTDYISIDEILLIIGDKDLGINDRAELEALLKDRGKGKYGVVVSTNSSTPAIRNQNFSMLLEAMKLGVPVSPAMLVRNSALAQEDKEEILDEIERQAQIPQVPLGPNGQPLPQINTSTMVGVK